MKQKMFLGVALFLAISMANLFGQVRIGDNADPHQGAILDLTNASNLGMLLPRVSLSDVSIWSLTGNPADGTAMVVYNTNNSVIGGNGSGVYVWDGSAWKPFKPLVAVTGVSLDKPTLTFTTTSTQTLTAMVAPSNASNKNVTWTSSNTSVATVVDGVVTPVGNGAATITVQTADGNFTAACNVTVAYAVTGVSLNTSTLNFTATTTQALSVTVAPDNAANKNVTWSSSNAGIATVSNGVVTPIANGTATITVTTIDGGYSAACAVTVNILVPVTGVSLDKSTLTFTSLASTQALIATVAPATATNKSVIWSSNNTNVATVSNGVVTPVGCGEAIITVRTADGNKTATCMVNVSYIVPKGVYSGSTVLDAPNRITSSEVINNYGFHPTGQDLELYPTDFNTDHLSFTWDEAQTACAAMGWRLPNLAELANLQSNNAYLNYGLQRSVYVTSNVFDGQRAWTWRHSRQANVFKYHKQSEISETE